ncbi:MAG: helix-turn-helix transcriptional regulator [Candidatus Hydrogenedentes bacterium]|nr:helix-turn-helix transcriptional regulator [Candidatus Hydrogenedentota bacterium]
MQAISDNQIHTLRKQIGEHIRNIRRAKGMTQEQLAKTANINQGDLSSIENGNASLGRDRAERIAQVLNINPDSINIRKQLSPQLAAAISPAKAQGGDTPASGTPPLAGPHKTNTPAATPNE